MKKYILTLIFIMLVSLVLNKEDVIPVVSYDSYDYSMYILEFPNKNISTNNLEMFNDVQIIWIYPYINEIYKDKINYQNYYFKNISLEENINNFKTDFINYLNNNGYKNDALNYQINGIKIYKMKVYAKESEIENLNIENVIVE